MISLANPRQSENPAFLAPQEIAQFTIYGAEDGIQGAMETRSITDS
jgi:hypothetical protein